MVSFDDYFDALARLDDLCGISEGPLLEEAVRLAEIVDEYQYRTGAGYGDA